MDASPVDGLTQYLLGLLIGLIAWIFNREISRTNSRVSDLEKKAGNHSERLAILDGKTENE